MRKTFFTWLLMAFFALPVLANPASGVVLDKATGEPIIGASILEKGTTNGTVTDFDGAFTLEVAEGATLEISYMGYAMQSIAAGENLSVQLAEDSEILDEVVVTGYTTQRKADLTGAVSVVSASDMQKMGEANPMKALQGKVPGLNIAADGNPSGASTVRIRGIGTLNNNDPLYIIDGVPTKGGMHELNPNDIESIQVLKDAASASIYGSRAANGVIVITTKGGADGKIKVDMDASVTTSSLVNRMKVLNAKEYGQVMWQAYVNDGMDPNTNNLGYVYNWGYDATGLPVLNQIFMKKYLDEAGTTPAGNTDWFKETTRTGVIQQYNMAVSAGGPKHSAYFSLGYYKNIGTIKYTDFDRLSARANTSFKLLKDIITIGENFSMNRTTEVAAPGGFLENVLQANPSLPVYTKEGEFAGPVGGYPDRENPLARLKRNKDNRYTYWRVFGNAFIDINPVKGLHIRTTAGLDYSQKFQRNFQYPITEGTMATSENGVTAVQEHWLKWMWNATASYALDINRHRADFLVGVELNEQKDTWFSGTKQEFLELTPNYMWPDAGTGEAQATGCSSGYKLLSFFGKANYTYDDRYLVSLTMRYDGSSRFGKNNRFALFPSVSAGWRISQERFMEKATWLDDLKLRASWGQTGNQEIDNYARYTIYVSNYGVSENGGQSYGTSYDITGSNGGSNLPSGFKRNQLGNEDIKWETTTQTDVGLDFAFLGNTLYGSFDWYYKTTKDILLLMPGIAAMGEGSGQWINAGSMKNMGEELQLGYRNKTKGGFKYDISVNLGSYTNEITKLPATVEASGTFGGNGVKSVVGHPMGAQVGYIADGIFKSQEEVDNHAIQEGAGVGRIRYRDIDGDGVITEKDQDWIYSPVPKVSFGANFYFEYKGLDITLFFQGVGGVQVISDLKKETDIWAGLNIGYLNKGYRLMNAWSPSNPDSDIPALTLSDNNNEKRVSSYWVEDGSFLKLRMVQIGYNLPQTALDKMHMQRWRFYVSAHNLFTIKSKSFTGVDPENPNFGYPIPLNVSVGTNISF